MVGAINAIESINPAGQLPESRQVLWNLETCDTCALTSVCAANCVLAHTNSTAEPAIGQELVFKAAEEILESASTRLLALVAKEPLEAPGLFFRIVRRWKAMPAGARPRLGFVTAAAAKLATLKPRFCEDSVDWCLISLDTASSGLRRASLAAPLLENALDVQREGGFTSLGVNTVLNQNNINQAVALGHRLSERNVFQWTLGPFLRPQNGRMEPVIDVEFFRRATERIAQEFAGSSMQIVFDLLDYRTLMDIVGHDARLRSGFASWRHEYQVSSNFLLVATNDLTFRRVRWDGEILSKPDFRQVGLRHGSFGRYHPGRITALMENFGQPGRAVLQEA